MPNVATATRERAHQGADLQELSTISTEALARLDRLVSAGLFASGLAHEVASPLSALLGAIAALERRLHDLRERGQTTPGDLDDLSEELGLASTTAGAITDLIHDFQFFLRAAPETRAVFADVREAVERALRMAGPRLRAVARLEVQMNAAPRVYARPSRIVQVVLNLLLNAAEAVASRPREANIITIRVDVTAARALIEVSDNGPGLPGDLGDQVFELAKRPRAGSTGAGLGLPISRELVRKMGGEIAVSSLPGAGTTFLVSVPRVV